MPDFVFFLIALLPVAAASGWYMARRGTRALASRPGVSDDYLRGLSYLVNDDADKAIQVFVRLLEVDNETVEIHLALGNLFRRQGEVDRALRIHQNLVARPNLSVEHRNLARYELARDYLRAGMLDRAEDLFRDLVDQGSFREQALSGLVAIYEQERDWQRAIEATRRLESVRGHTLRPITAQYLCELADMERKKRDLRAASQYLRDAYGEFRECVRSSLMQGEIEESMGNYENAIRFYRRVLSQDIDFLTEVLEPLQRCYERLGQADAWQAFLEDVTSAQGGVAARIAMSRLLVKQGRTQDAVDYLARYLQSTPSWLGFSQLLELANPLSGAGMDAFVERLRLSLRQLIQTGPRYKCGHCGFSTRTLYWQCPGCRQWNSITPLKDVMVQPA
jgi:lipopolysaccharide biosynthesis regulator YciM